ncbi:MAG: potassium channel family protein [Roseiflexus sp.]
MCTLRFLRALNPSLLIIARAATTEAEHKLRIAGATCVVSPYVLGGRSMASMALQPAVMDFLDLLLHSDESDTWLEEVAILPQSGLCGLRIDETNRWERAGLTILAIRRVDGRMVINPHPNTVLREHDTLIVLGNRMTVEPVGM